MVSGHGDDVSLKSWNPRAAAVTRPTRQPGADPFPEWGFDADGEGGDDADGEGGGDVDGEGDGDDADGEGGDDVGGEGQLGQHLIMIKTKPARVHSFKLDAVSLVETVQTLLLLCYCNHHQSLSWSFLSSASSSQAKDLFWSPCAGVDRGDVPDYNNYSLRHQNIHQYMFCFLSHHYQYQIVAKLEA